MAALLALASSLLVGGADYMSGLAARRTRPEAVPVLANLASLAVILVGAPFVAAPNVRDLDLVWGAAGGTLSAIGFIFFLMAMARGQMGVVAPVTAVVGAAVTVVVGLVRGERPSTASWVGITLAVVAIVFISATTGDQTTADPTTSGTAHVNRHTSTPLVAIVLAIGAGLGFGAFFAALSMTEADAGLWPLVPARLLSTPLTLALNLWLHGGWTVHRTARPLALWGGAAEGAASVLLLEALRRGDLTVVGVLGSLYPVSTVFLAWILLRERLHPTQWIGVAAALSAIPLITL